MSATVQVVRIRVIEGSSSLGNKRVVHNILNDQRSIDTKALRRVLDRLGPERASRAFPLRWNYSRYDRLMTRLNTEDICHRRVLVRPSHVFNLPGAGHLRRKTFYKHPRIHFSLDRCQSASNLVLTRFDRSTKHLAGDHASTAELS